MTTLQNKIDFAVVLRVKHANPNGDPLNGNRPRTDYNGNGEISDVCLKRRFATGYTKTVRRYLYNPTTAGTTTREASERELTRLSAVSSGLLKP